MVVYRIFTYIGERNFISHHFLMLIDREHSLGEKIPVPFVKCNYGGKDPEYYVYFVNLRKHYLELHTNEGLSGVVKFADAFKEGSQRIRDFLPYINLTTTFLPFERQAG